MSASARPPHAPRIGTAGWSIPKQYAAAFPPSGSHLERYAQRLNAVEINSSFYRPHRRATYERWADTVPENFAFAVKAPRAITHDARLADVEPALDRFLGEATGLGGKLGPLLFQLPPSFAFDVRKTRAFLKTLRARHGGAVVWEPRHATWFTPRAEELLAEYRVARVAADPAVVSAAAEPGGWDRLQYFRLHGAPRIYYSDYGADDIARVAARMTARSWCIFDNTALGAATANALALTKALA